MKIKLLRFAIQAPAPEGQAWLVIGPQCWGRDKLLSKAISNAAPNLGYSGGTFRAKLFVGDVSIDDFNGGVSWDKSKLTDAMNEINAAHDWHTVAVTNGTIITRKELIEGEKKLTKQPIKLEGRMIHSGETEH